MSLLSTIVRRCAQLVSPVARPLAARATVEMRGLVRQELAGFPDRQAQLLLYHTYRTLARTHPADLPSLTDVGFRCHSQFEEDGILLYLFAVLGTTNKTCVEICAGDGLQNNTTNLVLHHGWWGHMFDGLADNVARGTAYFRQSPETYLYPPRFTHAWITAENVNALIAQSGAVGEIDLLSLDLDGMDYWIWKAIDVVRPRVVVCEVHNVIGPEDALTVPYDPHFVVSTPDYNGASLAAMTILAREKGYRLVGTHRYGFNAFFVRDGLGEALLPTVTPAQCQSDPYSREAHATRWSAVRDLPWVRIPPGDR